MLREGSATSGRVPVTALTGVGKTILPNHLRSGDRGHRTTVMVNDFGDITRNRGSRPAVGFRRTVHANRAIGATGSEIDRALADLVEACASRV